MVENSTEIFYSRNGFTKYGTLSKLVATQIQYETAMGNSIANFVFLRVFAPTSLDKGICKNERHRSLISLRTLHHSSTTTELFPEYTTAMNFFQTSNSAICVTIDFYDFYHFFIETAN